MIRGGTVIHGLSKHDTTVLTGKYVSVGAGNNSLNRAVAHGLGRIPFFAILIRNDGYHWLQTVNGVWKYLLADLTTVTAFDSTNVYIGDNNIATATNNSANTYELVVWG